MEKDDENNFLVSENIDIDTAYEKLDLDDLSYEEEVRKKILSAREDIKQGRVYTDSEMKKRFNLS